MDREPNERAIENLLANYAATRKRAIRLIAEAGQPAATDEEFGKALAFVIFAYRMGSGLRDVTPNTVN